MLLSQAMRKGAESTQQCHGSLFFRQEHVVVQTCALGAVYLGTFGPPVDGYDEDSTGEELFSSYPVLHTLYPVPEVFGRSDTSKRPIPWELVDIVVGLNDNLEWTREQIAGWLESQGL